MTLRRPGLKGILRQQRTVLTLLFLAIAVWLLTYWRTFDGIVPYDAQDYAQMGRQIYRGRGFSTEQIWAPEIRLLKERNLLLKDWPNLHRFPLPCISDALSFVVWGPNDFAVAFGSGIFFILAIPLVYLLGTRMFDRRTGLLSAGMVLASRELLRLSLTGMSEPSAAFLLLLLLFLLLRPDRLELDSFWLGVVTGLAFLDRYNFALFIPFIAFYLFRATPSRKVLTVLKYCAGLGLVVSPWLVRNYLVAGNPFASSQWQRFILGGYTDAEAEGVAQPGGLGLLGVILHNPGPFLARWTHHLLLVWRTPGLQPEYYSLGALVLAFFFPAPPETSRLRTLLILLFGIQFLVMSLGVMVPRYFVFFVPIAFVFVARIVFTVLERIPWPRTVPGIVAGCLLLCFALPTVRALKRGERRPSVETENVRACAPLLDKNWVVGSTSSVSIAWYVDRRAVRLPLSVQEFLEIGQSDLEIQAIFLAPQHTRRESYYQGWLTSRPLSERYQVAKTFSSGAKLLVRRSRAPG